MIYYETAEAIQDASNDLNAMLQAFDSYVRDEDKRDELIVGVFRKNIKMLRLKLDELRDLQANETSVNNQRPVRGLRPAPLHSSAVEEQDRGRKPSHGNWPKGAARR